MQEKKVLIRFIEIKNKEGLLSETFKPETKLKVSLNYTSKKLQ